MGGGGNFCQFSLTNEKLKAYALCLLSILCIHWGIASYQPFIQTCFVLLFGGIISIIIDEKGNLKTSLYKSRFLTIAVALAAISYKIMFDIFKKNGKIIEAYNNQMISLNDLPDRIVMAFKVSFTHLFTYESAFMPLFMTKLFALFVIIFLLFLFFLKSKLSVKIIFCFLFIAVVFTSQMNLLLSKTIRIYPETDFYGLLFLRILFVALTFKFCAHFVHSQKLIQNLLFILSSILIWICVVQASYAQKIQKLAFDVDSMLLNRVIDRIEQVKNFSYEKKYCGIMFGNIEKMRLHYYRNGSHPKYDSNYAFITSVLIPDWNPIDAFQYIMPKNIFSNCNFYSSRDYKEYKSVYSLISRLHKAGILDTLEPFPHKNSVVVFEDIIVFVASKGNLDEIKAMAAKEFGKGAEQ